MITYDKISINFGPLIGDPMMMTRVELDGVLPQTIELLKSSMVVGQQFETIRDKNTFVIEKIEEEGIRVKTKAGKRPRYFLRFDEINAIIHNFHPEPEGVIKYVNRVHQIYGFTNTTSEIHIYVIAKNFWQSATESSIHWFSGSDQIRYLEGNRIIRTHVWNEVFRSRKLIEDAKKQYLKNHKHLECEICGLIPKMTYELDSDIIEGHHLVPLSQIKKEYVAMFDDIMLLCPNCHRAVHRYLVEHQFDCDFFKRETLKERLIIQNS